MDPNHHDRTPQPLHRPTPEPSRTCCLMFTHSQHHRISPEATISHMRSISKTQNKKIGRVPQRPSISSKTLLHQRRGIHRSKGLALDVELKVNNPSPEELVF